MKTSLEWSDLSTSLRKKAVGLHNEKDILVILNNISRDVTKLSNAEVLLRRGHKLPYNDLLIKINKDLELIDEYILIAKLAS